MPVSTGGPVCIPNISAPERHRRLIGGVVSSALALGVLGVLMTKRVDQRWRLAVFPLFWGASVGFFQWRDKT
ncbi:MAG TPA: hypothetical protein VKE94_18410 [Gemmataceae bacterium]|nr:hypothetical protein [Gemmataceae bacterium]